MSAVPGDAMILIQIDTLSLNELQSIAEQEGIENYRDMSRDELIAELRDIYEDSDIASDSTEQGVNKRFVSGLTNFRGDEAEVESLPGVENLPEIYNETSVHILSKNSSWVYCYWSLSTHDEAKYAEKYGSFHLLLNVKITGEHEEEYDIVVGEKDIEWNINVPRYRGYCSVRFELEADDGRRLVLAESETLPLINCYWLEHTAEAVGEEDLIRRYLSILTTREGDLASCQTVREIVDNIKVVEGL